MSTSPRSPKRSPRRDPNDLPAAVGARLHQRLHELSMTADDDFDATLLMAIVQSAMSLEQKQRQTAAKLASATTTTPRKSDVSEAEAAAGGVEECVAVLSHAVRVARTVDCRSVILNNLACVEQRRGKLPIAVHHLERAADEEGGMSLAQPTTLLNLSAAYTAQKQYAEAAAVAHHAVKRCLADGTVRPTLTASAHYNLGAALMAAGELEHAASSFRAGFLLVSESESEVRAKLLKTLESVEKQIAAKQQTQDETQWAAHVRPSLIRRAQAVARKQPDAPSFALTSKSATAEETMLATKIIGPGTASAYLAPVRLRRPIHPVAAAGVLTRKLSPVKMARTPSPTVNAAATTTTAAAASPMNHSAQLPDWNNDTVVGRKTRGNASADMSALDADVRRHVAESYMPRRLIPLAEDLRYKETTRRRTLEIEWRKAFAKIESLMNLQRIVAAEDEARAELEIDEQRVRHVLSRWIAGKIVFVKGSLELEASEHKGREVIASECGTYQAQVLQPHAEQVKIVASEETGRCLIAEQEDDSNTALALNLDTNAAVIGAREGMRQSKKGLACALAAWALEAVLAQSEAVTFVPDALKTSLAVTERYASFGLPKGQPKKGAHENAPESPTSASSPNTLAPAS